jgi:hypothetical protein
VGAVANTARSKPCRHTATVNAKRQESGTRVHPIFEFQNENRRRPLREDRNRAHTVTFFLQSVERHAAPLLRGLDRYRSHRLASGRAIPATARVADDHYRALLRPLPRRCGGARPARGIDRGGRPRARLPFPPLGAARSDAPRSHRPHRRHQRFRDDVPLQPDRDLRLRARSRPELTAGALRRLAPPRDHPRVRPHPPSRSGAGTSAQTAIDLRPQSGRLPESVRSSLDDRRDCDRGRVGGDRGGAAERDFPRHDSADRRRRKSVPL